MSLALFKERIRAILLFFIDYKALLLCFTIFSLNISSANLLEKVVFENQELSSMLLFQILKPTLVLELIFFVSCTAFTHVHFFTTLVKVFLLSSFLVLGSTYLNFEKITKDIENVRGFTSKKVWISGVMMSQEKSNSYLFHSDEGGLGNSIARFNQYPVLHVGQRCKLMVKVVQPKSFEDFDYRRYLFRKGIYSILEVEEYICSDGGNIFLELRYRLERIVEKSIPEPEASLIIGIMFGSKRIFRSDFNTALNSSGVSHVIAASGYNVALVAQGVETFFRDRRGKGILVIKILCIWAFSIFSGLSPSLIRASTMTTLSLFAFLLGRESNQSVSLLFCITLLMFLNPFLIYDVGFHKSATSKCFKESILPTFTCILFTFPISVIFFGKVSVISLISNVIILPIVGSSIFWGLGVTFLNIFLPLKILYLIPYIQLNIFKQFVLISSNINMLEVNINKYVVGVCIYLTLFLFCLLKYPVSSNNYYILQAKKYG